MTGAEALYADMGHFGRAAITRAWLLLVFPACILNYLVGDGITHATARFGFMDAPNIPEVMRLVEQAPIEAPIDLEQLSYFLATIELTVGDSSEISRWRKRLFLATAEISADAAEHFGLPRDLTVVMGLIGV